MQSVWNSDLKLIDDSIGFEGVYRAAYMTALHDASTAAASLVSVPSDDGP